MTSRETRSDLDAQIVIVGAQSHPLRDIYHALLRASGIQVVLFLVAIFVALNTVFALLYLLLGGVAHARPGSFLDAFSFSVQTMATIGYGAMYPEAPGAHVVVIVEAIVGIVYNAMATGLVFTKFSQPTARMVFSRQATIQPINGVPTLSFRLGNDRSNAILEATIRVAITRTERTREGSIFYRMYDLTLARDRSPALARSWTVFHPIVAPSPLAGRTPADLVAEEVELLVTVVGTDDLSMQPVIANYRYTIEDILWGASHVDILSERPDGLVELDLRRFHDVVPTEPTDDFPYRWTPPGASRTPPTHGIDP